MRLDEPMMTVDQSMPSKLPHLQQQAAEERNRALLAPAQAEPVIRIGMGAVFGGVFLANLATGILFAVLYYLATH